MKIIMVCNYFYPVTGGEENHIYNLSKRLVKKGHTVEVFTINKTYQGEVLPESGEKDGILIKRFPGKLSLFRSVMGAKCDVIHYHHYRSPFIDFGVLAGKLSKKRRIFTPYCAYPPRSFFNIIVKKVYDLTLGKMTLNFVERMISLTESDKGDLIKLGADPKKITIIPNAIAFERFEKLEKPTLFNEKFGIGQFILHVGRLDWNKGVKYVVKAMPDIIKDYPEMKFVIIGEDVGFKKEVEEEVEKLDLWDAVIFLGSVSTEELLSAYAACKVFVLASKYEGLPTVVLEAMAYEKPVIATKTGGTQYVIKDGYSGYLVDYADPEEIYNAVKKAVGNKEIGENARKEVKEKYTWSAAAPKIEEVYRELLKKE
jgi:glycosyltransferase involved in cell wall biosynthesis